MEKVGIIGIADETNSSSLYYLEKEILRIFFIHDMKTFSMRFNFNKENLKEILDHISSLEKLMRTTKAINRKNLFTDQF